MALIELNLQPGTRELRWFGILVPAFFALLAGLLWWSSKGTVGPALLVGLGAAFGGLYALVPRARLLLYTGWLRAVYPLGWLISHALIGVVYFGVVTPIGWALRLAGQDPMHRRIQRGTNTYWVERRDTRQVRDYFRQF